MASASACCRLERVRSHYYLGGCSTEYGVDMYVCSPGEGKKEAKAHCLDSIWLASARESCAVYSVDSRYLI